MLRRNFIELLTAPYFKFRPEDSFNPKPFHFQVTSDPTFLSDISLHLLVSIQHSLFINIKPFPSVTSFPMMIHLPLTS
jgi:hypothetical protein